MNETYKIGWWAFVGCLIFVDISFYVFALMKNYSEKKIQSLENLVYLAGIAISTIVVSDSVNSIIQFWAVIFFGRSLSKHRKIDDV